MDFDFFMSVVRSEDEASRQAEWQHLRNQLTISGNHTNQKRLFLGLDQSKRTPKVT